MDKDIIITELASALLTLLNVEGVAKWGAEDHSPGLDVPYHFENARAALKLLSGEQLGKAVVG